MYVCTHTYICMYVHIHMYTYIQTLFSSRKVGRAVQIQMWKLKKECDDTLDNVGKIQHALEEVQADPSQLSLLYLSAMIEVCMCVYIYIHNISMHVYIHIYMCVCIYIYI